LNLTSSKDVTGNFSSEAIVGERLTVSSSIRPITPM
jgi:hypothetical protein